MNLVMDMINTLVMNQGKVSEGVLMMLNGIINTFPSSMVHYAPQIMQYASFSINSSLEVSDSLSCRMACGLVSDMAHSIENHMSQHLGSIMPLLLNVIQSEMEIDTKTFAINAIGDLCLNSENKFEAFIETALDKVCNAISVVKDNPLN